MRGTMTIKERLEQAKIQALRLEDNKHFFMISPGSDKEHWSQDELHSIADMLSEGIGTIDTVRQDDFFMVIPTKIDVEIKSFRQLEDQLGLVFQMNGWRRPQKYVKAI